MSWETSVTESAKAVGVTNESPFLFDLWKQASRCYGVATYQSAGTTVSGDLGGYRPLERADDADDPVGNVLPLVRRRLRGGARRKAWSARPVSMRS